jgi:phosphatidylserine/phosphatidylglycerophosphate/cardiolipin synthase-like enzyme
MNVAMLRVDDQIARGLAANWPDREILLSEVLAELLAAGTRVTVATNDHAANRTFPAALRAAASRLDATSGLRIAPIPEAVTEEERGLHRKRLVTDHAILWGSMNLTRSGYERNAEDAALEVDPADVAAAVNEMEQLHPSGVTSRARRSLRARNPWPASLRADVAARVRWTAEVDALPQDMWVDSSHVGSNRLRDIASRADHRGRGREGSKTRSVRDDEVGGRRSSALRHGQRLV